RMFGLLGDQYALAQTDEGVFGHFLPLGFAREPQSSVGGGFGKSISSGNMARGLTAVGPDKLGGHPNEVAQIRGCRQGDAADAAKRDPIVFTVENQLEDRAESRIGISNPAEWFAVQRSRTGGSGFEGLLPKFGRGAKLTAPDMFQRLNQEADPLQRLAEDQRSKFALKHASPQRFTLDHRLKDLRQHHRVGVYSRDDLQLHQGFRPIPQKTMKLKQKDPQLRVLGTGADLVLQFDQGVIGRSGGKSLLGGHDVGPK